MRFLCAFFELMGMAFGAMAFLCYLMRQKVVDIIDSKKVD